ncbi:MAG: TRAFs-binding domain-containing protein, partial [Pseudomonadota bacterium]
VLEDTSRDDFEHSQALGLMGRTHKQIYIDNLEDPLDHSQDAAIRNAIKWYRQGHEIDFDFGQRIWHGINLAAVIHKAEVDGISIDEEEEWQSIAESLLKQITEKSKTNGGKLESWEFATAGEAAFALSDSTLAESWFERYRDSEPDNFQVAGTVRQLRELWGKKFDDPKTGGILLRMQAQVAKSEAAGLEFGGEEIEIAQSLATDESMLSPQGRINDAEYTSIHWFVNGLERANAVIRIGKNEDDGLGTGFVVSKDELLGGEAGNPAYASWPEFVALTNAHVTTDDTETRLNPPDSPDGRQLYQSHAPSKVFASFQAQRSVDRRWPKQHRVKQLFTSPFSNLDLTVLAIEGWNPSENFKPCPICDDPPSQHTNRILVIGHPLGQGIKFSTEGSKYLGHSQDPEMPDPETKVEIRYSSPTDGGSSGSPVFEDQNWEVVGVHQGMVTNATNNIDGSKFDANQAVWMESVRRAFKNSIN